MLVTEEAAVNTMDAYGQTAIAWAAQEDQKKSILTLFEAGAKINVVDCHGLNALKQCVLNKFVKRRKEMCMLLYAAGESTDGTTIEVKEVDGLC